MAMTREQLVEKLEKAQENVSKVEKTIERHQARFVKLTNKLAGYKCQTKEQWFESGEYRKTQIGNENWWVLCDVASCESDIKTSNRKLNEKKLIVENWKEKIKNLEETHNRIKELPQALQDYEVELIAKWDEHDKIKAVKVREARNKFYEWRKANEDLDYKAIREMEEKMRYSPSTEEYYLGHDAEYWHKENVYNANILILNLVARVEKKVGEITEYGLYLTYGNEYEGTVLNGTVIGTKGTATVESIIAGGWNIQKEHIRTLVK